MKLPIKLTPEAKKPEQANAHDAGWDLFACKRTKIGNILTYDTGVSVAIPEGHVGLLFPRSSICKYDLELCNSVGVIDSGYRGTIQAKFRELIPNDFTKKPKIYNLGDKICQLVIVPISSVELDFVDSLPKSERGENGFGSSGN